MSQASTEQEAAHDARSLFNDAMRMVAQQIPPRAMAWLWTIHIMHGDENCPAHRQGDKCCVDVLLENTPPITVPALDGSLADIIRAGYDLVIESDSDDRAGPVNVYLSYQGQGVTDELKLQAMPDTILQALVKARDYAVAFPTKGTAQ